jgi:hypothetical protein
MESILNGEVLSNLVSAGTSIGTEEATSCDWGIWAAREQDPG